MRVMVTGHRLFNSPDQSSWARSELERLAWKLSDRHPDAIGLSGLALGSDTHWADAVLGAGLGLWVYLPFEGQEAKWKEHDRKRYAELRAKALREHIAGPRYDVRYFHDRNYSMLRDADVVVAVLDPRRRTGGTVSTLNRARRDRKRVIMLDLLNRCVSS